MVRKKCKKNNNYFRSSDVDVFRMDQSLLSYRNQPKVTDNGYVYTFLTDAVQTKIFGFTGASTVKTAALPKFIVMEFLDAHLCGAWLRGRISR